MSQCPGLRPVWICTDMYRYGILIHRDTDIQQKKNSGSSDARRGFIPPNSPTNDILTLSLRTLIVCNQSQQ